MKVRIITLILIVTFLVASPAISQPIKIATWNIENLRDSNNELSNRRNQNDYDRLAGKVVEIPNIEQIIENKR